VTDHGREILQAALDRVGAYPASLIESWMLAPALCRLQPGDRRAERSLRLAVEALAAHAAADWHRYYAVGHGLLLHAAQRHRRATSPCQGDRLTQWVKAYLAEHPEATTAETVQAVISSAGAGGPVLADYDPGTGTVTYQPSADREALRDIAPGALRRRIERLMASR